MTKMLVSGQRGADAKMSAPGQEIINRGTRRPKTINNAVEDGEKKKLTTVHSGGQRFAREEASWSAIKSLFVFLTTT
jgi:hypothetical protein